VLVVSVAASLLGVSAATPVSAEVPRLRATAVTAGAYDSCALLEEGSTRCWGAGFLAGERIGDDEAPGSRAPLDFGGGRRATDLSAGLAYGCAVLDDGSVRCWGQNDNGVLGNGSLQRQDDPAAAPHVDLGGVAAVDVETGYDHACAVLVDGDIRCWGRSRSGDLGLGDTRTIGDDEAVDSVPPVDLGPGRQAVSVAVGVAHTCALLDDGSVRCWGAGAAGENGLGTGVAVGDDETPAGVPPVDLGPGRIAVALAASYHTTCAVLDDGSVRCWGLDLGLLGAGAPRGGQAVGDDETPGSLPSIDLGVGRTAVAIGAGGWHTCAVLDDGTLRCWGQNDEGQLGYGNTEMVGDDETPGSVTAVDLGTGRTAVSVDGGQHHTCALLDDGAVRCWGLNGIPGILGLGNGTEENVGDDEVPSAVDPIDLGSLTTPELAVSVAVTPTEAYVGDEVGIDVTLTNTGGVALTGVAVDLPDAPGCTGSVGSGSLPLRAAVTVRCARMLTAADVGSLPIAPSATSDQTPTPTVAESVRVSVLDAPSGVTGTVRDSVTGDPVPGAMVAVLRASDHRVIGGAVADAQGRYRAVTDPGDVFAYVLDPAGAHTAAVAGDPVVRTVVPHELVASDLTVAPTRGSLSGTVTDAARRTPVRGAFVVVMDRGGSVERVVTADAQGRYAAAGLPVGEHVVGFIDPYGGQGIRFHADAISVPAATPVTVTAGERTVVDAALPSQSAPITSTAVTGAVTDEGTGAPVPGAVVIALRASDYRLDRATAAGADGRYRLDLPATGHVLAVLDPAGHHAAQWFDGHPNTALDQADLVTAPAVADVALRSTVGAIRGVISDDPTGTPVVGAWALAIGPAGIAGAAVTGADGSYTVPSLAPGSYRVALVDPAGGRDLEYVDGHAGYDDADPIVVTAGDTATADAALHRGPVPLAMGGSGNTLGNDPEQWATPGYVRPYFWLNVASPLSTKVNGDRYTAGNCTGAYSGCSGATNLDYAEEGYVYRVAVGADAADEDLHVQVFDPAFTVAGNTCTDGNLDVGSGWAAELVAQGAPSDAAARYAAGNGPWCVADANYGGSNVETTYIVRGPDTTPDDALDNPVACAKTFGAYDEVVSRLLDQTDGYRDGPIGPEQLPFLTHFRRWTDVCTVPAAAVVAGDYFLQVTTTADQSDPPGSLSRFDPEVATGGYNKYAVRAGSGAPGVAGFADDVEVTADGRLPIYVNQAGAGTTSGFELARVPSRYAGRTLEVELFDVADGANATLTVLPPPDRTGSPLPPCTFTRDASPPAVETSDTCTLTGLTNASYNGRTVTLRLPLPDDYRCESRRATGCRFRLRLDFGAGAPTDQTTWTARIR